MDKENELINKYRMYIAITNFEDECKLKETRIERKSPLKEVINKWREYKMKKRVIVTTIIGMFLASSVAFAANNENVKKYLRGLGGGIDSAIENGYIENPNIDSINKNINISDGKSIDNINVETKIDNFLMDDYNLSVEFSFKFDDNINKYVNLDNIHNIEIKDLIIKDEENKILYAGEKETFSKYCKENNLEYKFVEFNENYFSSGLNFFTSYCNKEDKIVKLMYNMYSDNYPKSKRLEFYFENITINETNNQNMVDLKGEWKINLEVPEKMYNRVSESYKVISCSNDDFNVYSCLISDTGFEIGLTINNIEKVEYPEEIEKIRREVWKKYEGEIDQTEANKEFNKIISKEPYKKLINEYWYKRDPIRYTNVYRFTENGIEINENENISYIENEDGKQFKCTLSPSRKTKGEWIGENKYNFYETFGMTKYDSTNKIKAVLYYYGEPVTIELEKSK